MKNYQQLIRTTGAYSLIASGISAAIALCFHPDEFVPGAVLLPAWTPVHLTLLFSFTISIFGVAAIFLTMPEKPGVLGLLAYILGVVGCAWSASVVVLEVFVLPVIAQQATQQVPLMDIMSPSTPFQLLGKFFMSAVMLWILAWVSTGIVLLRSAAFKKYVGALIIIASIAIAVPTHFADGLSGPLHVIVSILFGASWIIAGIAITKTAEPGA